MTMTLSDAIVFEIFFTGVIMLPFLYEGKVDKATITCFLFSTTNI